MAAEIMNPDESATVIVGVSLLPDGREPEDRRDTLNALLGALNAADNEMECLAVIQELDVVSDGRRKVDNYKYMLDKLEGQAEFLEAREKEYAAAKKAVQNNIKQLKSNLLFALQNNGFEKFTGYEWVVSQRRGSYSVEITAGDCLPMHAVKYGDYVRVKYEWDRDAIRQNFGTDPIAAELGKLKQSVWPQFSINKEAAVTLKNGKKPAQLKSTEQEKDAH